MEVEVLSRVRTSLVIVEEAVLPGKMLGHTLLHQKRVVVFGDWPRGDGHLVLLIAKCSAQAHGGGASVLEVDEEAFASRHRAFSDSSLERAVGAMGFGLTYAGIEPILKVEWMPKICQALRCLATEPNPARQFTNLCLFTIQVVILECVAGAGNDAMVRKSRSCSSVELGSMVKSWVGGWISCWSTLLRVFVCAQSLGRACAYSVEFCGASGAPWLGSRWMH